MLFGAPVFFDNWMGLLRVIIVGTLAYVGLVVFLRTSGKRTLAKMNAFDWVVTVALGSTLATVLLSEDVALAEGLMGFAVLIALQFLVAWLSVRSTTVRRLVKSEPRMLVYRGELLREAMHAERVSEAEVLQAVRSEGGDSLSSIEVVVLETDGSFSVVRPSEAEQKSALENINGP